MAPSPSIPKAVSEPVRMFASPTVIVLLPPELAPGEELLQPASTAPAQVTTTPAAARRRANLVRDTGGISTLPTIGMTFSAGAERGRSAEYRHDLGTEVADHVEDFPVVLAGPLQAHDHLGRHPGGLLEPPQLVDGVLGVADHRALGEGR